MAGRSGQVRSASSVLVVSLQCLRFSQSSAAPIATPSAIQMGSLVNTKAQAPSAPPTPIQCQAKPEFSIFLLTALTTQPILALTQHFGSRSSSFYPSSSTPFCFRVFESLSVRTNAISPKTKPKIAKASIAAYNTTTIRTYSTVTLLARLRGLSTSVPLATAT